MGCRPQVGVRARQALLARVAEILDINQQKLEDAFNQARSKMPDGAAGEGLPGLSEDLLATVAEIPKIDQRTLEGAFAQAQSEMPDRAPRERPSDRNAG